MDDEAYQRGRQSAFEECSNIAAQCARGTAVEIGGETHPLGVMMATPALAQYATATTIMEAIDAIMAEQDAGHERQKKATVV